MAHLGDRRRLRLRLRRHEPEPTGAPGGPRRARRWRRAVVASAACATVPAGVGGWSAADAQPLVSGPPPGAVTAHRLTGMALPGPGRDDPERTAAWFRGRSPAEQQRLAHRYPRAVGTLDGAPTALRYEANRLAGAPYPQTLDYDPRGGGRIAEVFGDLARARRIAVVVPGDDTDLTSYRDGRAPIRSMARRLYAQERRAFPGVRAAVVAWAGYTTPHGLGPDAAEGRLAEAGARRLDLFLRGLAATTRAAAPPALFCHSYGSVACGLAVRALPPGSVSDLVVMGSPGMRVERAAQLKGADRVWATAHDRGEWIGDVSGIDLLGLGHGTDPTDPAFGARPIGSAGAVGHDGYFAPGTASLREYAEIATGRTGRR